MIIFYSYIYHIFTFIKILKQVLYKMLFGLMMSNFKIRWFL
jgi:hypothetical protein